MVIEDIQSILMGKHKALFHKNVEYRMCVSDTLVYAVMFAKAHWQQW